MKRILPALVLLATATAAYSQIATGSATPRSGNENAVFPERLASPLPGLWQMRNSDAATSRRELGPVMAFTADTYTSPLDGTTTTWTEKDVWLYEGEIYLETGKTYRFASFVDDYVTISIGGTTVHSQGQNKFSCSRAYSCSETGWHPITIRVWDTGGAYGKSSNWTHGIAYNTAGQTSQTPLSGWTQLIDPGNGSLLRTSGPTCGLFVMAKMRETDPTVMDIDYIIYTNSATPTMNVRALAFEDGERGFATVVRPETFIEGTDANIGDGIAANVAHRLSWKVSSDWATDLAKVSFEVMVMKPGDLLLPDMHFVTIPAAEGHPKTIVSVNDLSKDAYEITRDSDYYDGIYRTWWYESGSYGMTSQHGLLNALFWLYACGENDLFLSNGVLSTNGQDLVRHCSLAFLFLNSYGRPFPFTSPIHFSREWSLVENPYRYVFGKMGYRLLEDENELGWVNENTRLGLDPIMYRQYAVKTVEE